LTFYQSERISDRRGDRRASRRRCCVVVGVMALLCLIAAGIAIGVYFGGK